MLILIHFCAVGIIFLALDHDAPTILIHANNGPFIMFFGLLIFLENGLIPVEINVDLYEFSICYLLLVVVERNVPTVLIHVQIDSFLLGIGFLFVFCGFCCWLNLAHRPRPFHGNIYTSWYSCLDWGNLSLSPFVMQLFWYLFY